MNNTDKAKLDTVRRMLKGQIDVEEIAMITGVSLEKVKRMREEQDQAERKALGGLTVREVGFGDVLIDNDVLEEPTES